MRRARMVVLVTVALTGCGSEPCGDGTVDTTEDCDDDNRYDGDGCSAACRQEQQGATTATCATPTLVRWIPAALGDAALVIGNSRGGGETASLGSCGGGGLEHVLEVRVTRASRLLISVDRTTGPGVLRFYARDADCAAGTEIDCKTALDRPIDAAVEPGSYFVFIDTDASTGGSGTEYSVLMSMQPN